MFRYIFIFIFFLFINIGFAQSDWKAPISSDKMINPIQKNDENIKKGAKIYKSLCASCHGVTGKADVLAMQSLVPKPTNFTTSIFQNQTDGAIFWKLSEGRGLMASYKNMLSEKERWQVVHFLRELKTKPENKIDETKNVKTFTTENTLESFAFTGLINSKTTHIMQPKGFGLTIQHRFGVTKFDNEFISNFMGLDLAANMRFAFEIPINKKLMTEIGRTRYGKFYDLGLKYLAVQQTKNNSIPFSLAIYENVAITTEKAPQYSDVATFDNHTKFEYLFRHRLFYDTQIMISRKFSNNFSAQIACEFVCRNLTPPSVKPKEKSYVIAIPVSMRYKFGLSSAISLELMPNSHPKTMPIALGYEVASSGNHVFQITVTNTDRILSHNIFFNPTTKYGKGEFMLGFNLIRYF